MYEYPWYMTSWRYIILVFLQVAIALLLKIGTYKVGKKAVEIEIYKARGNIFHGEEAIRYGRFAARFGDLLFWFFIFVMIIFIVREFKYLF